MLTIQTHAPTMRRIVHPRPSSTDRFFECASSALEPEAPHAPNSAPARGGSAVHYAIDVTIETGETPDLEMLAMEYGVEPAEVRIPFAMWRRAWETLAPYFPQPQSEVRIDGPLSGGTVDLLSVSPDRITFADWKSGRIVGSHEYQLTSYAHALRGAYGMPSEGVIRGAAVHLRHEWKRVYTFDDAKLDAFEKRFKAQLKRVGTHYAAGEHCGFCPRRFECRTRAAHVRSSIQSLQERPASLDARGLVALYPQYRAAKKLLEEYHDAVTAACSSGPVPMGDGMELRLAERARQKIDARAAWPILRQHLTDDEMASVISVTKTAAVNAVKAKAQRGHKGRMAEELIEQLRDAGAVEENPYSVLVTGPQESER